MPAVILVLGRWKQEDQKFKVILGYALNLRPASTIWDPISNRSPICLGSVVFPLNLGNVIAHPGHRFPDLWDGEEKTKTETSPPLSVLVAAIA